MFAVQRENDYGEPVGWEELPTPPAPNATAIRPPPATAVSSATQTLPTTPTSDIIESVITSRGGPSSRSQHARSLNVAARDIFRAATVANTPTGTRSPSAERRMQLESSSSSGRRSQWMLMMSQRVAAERILTNPRADRETRQEAMQTLMLLREQERSGGVPSSELDLTGSPSQLPPPPRPSTQTISRSSHSRRSDSSTPMSSTTTAITPSSVTTFTRNATTSTRHDEAMEPIYPEKAKQMPMVPPPAGLSNWLYQVGIDCMVKWEEMTLSR